MTFSILKFETTIIGLNYFNIATTKDESRYFLIALEIGRKFFICTTFSLFICSIQKEMGALWLMKIHFRRNKEKRTNKRKLP